MSVFRITEIPVLGGRGVRGTPASFEWGAKTFNKPFRPWAFGTEMRHKRTDYPGGSENTHQIFGPNDKPFTLNGKWDDRYNSPDYAIGTMFAFDAMVRRGNRVRFELDEVVFEGFVIDADYEFHRRWEIHYAFTVSPERRVGTESQFRVPTGTAALDVTQLQQELTDLITSGLDAHTSAPQDVMAGDLYADVSEDIDSWGTQMSEIDLAVDDRLRAEGGDEPEALLRLAVGFATIKSTAAELLDRLIEVRSDLDLGYQTAIGVLEFEEWARGLSDTAREIMLSSDRASREMSSRADPDVFRVYSPSQNEHLYGISRQFYGTPRHWRAIMDRNGLVESTMQGTELLVIPEVPQG